MTTELDPNTARITALEQRVGAIEKDFRKNEKQDTKTHMEVKNIKQEFLALKNDVLNQLTNYSEKTWKLINTLLRVILFLISAIVLISTGIKLGPNIMRIIGA